MTKTVRVSEQPDSSAPAAKPSSAGFDRLLLCAFHLWRARERGRRYRVVIVTDDPGRYSERVCRSILGQWNEWVTIDSYVPVDSEASLAGARADPAAACLAVASNEALLGFLRADCARAGMPFFEPRLTEHGGIDDDFYREVSFFDQEFGGRNEWDDSPTKWPQDALRQLSATHCAITYPTWGLEGMSRRRLPWRALDVGCGPISRLRWGALAGEMHLTGLDPLLEMYALVRAKHGHDALPEIRCAVEIPGFAEQLDELVADETFDLIYTQNALDHTREPLRVVSHFARKLAPGGRVIVQVATREGTRQNWDQFHKTDIDLRDGSLVYRHQHSEERPLLPPETHLRVLHVHQYTPEWLAVVLERG